MGVLVKKPLNNWKKATPKLEFQFSKATYHAQALDIASNFLSVMNNEVPSIKLHIDSSTARCIKKNRVKLKSIIDTVLFCGYQSHRDEQTSIENNPDLVLFVTVKTLGIVLISFALQSSFHFRCQA